MSNDPYEQRRIFSEPPTLLEKIISVTDAIRKSWWETPNSPKLGKSNYLEDLMNNKNFPYNIYSNPFSKEERERQTKAYNAMVFYEENVDKLSQTYNKAVSDLGVVWDVVKRYCLRGYDKMNNPYYSEYSFKFLVSIWFETTLEDMDKEWKHLPKYLRK